MSCTVRYLYRYEAECIWKYLYRMHQLTSTYTRGTSGLVLLGELSTGMYTVELHRYAQVHPGVVIYG